MKNYSLVVFISGLVSLLRLIRKLLVWKTFEMKIRKSIENKKSRSSGKVAQTHADWSITASSKWLESNPICLLLFLPDFTTRDFFDKRPNTGIF